MPHDSYFKNIDIELLITYANQWIGQFNNIKFNRIELRRYSPPRKHAQHLPEEPATLYAVVFKTFEQQPNNPEGHNYHIKKVRGEIPSTPYEKFIAATEYRQTARPKQYRGLIDKGFRNIYHKGCFPTDENGNPLKNYLDQWTFIPLAKSEKLPLGVDNNTIPILLYKHDPSDNYIWPSEPALYESTDAVIDHYSILARPEQHPKNYSNEYNDRAIDDALSRGGFIKLEQLIYLLAVDVSTSQLLPKLWDKAGFNHPSAKALPNWDDSIMQTNFGRARLWCWILCRFTMGFKSSSYFGHIQEKEPLTDFIPVYQVADKGFESIQNFEDIDCMNEDCYVQIKEVEKNLNIRLAIVDTKDHEPFDADSYFDSIQPKQPKRPLKQREVWLTGEQITKKYDTTVTTILDYMRQGLKALNENEKKVCNIDDLEGEDQRQFILNEMCRSRGQGLLYESHPKFKDCHYMSFDFPQDDYKRKEFVLLIESFKFREDEFIKYHYPLKRDQSMEQAIWNKCIGPVVTKHNLTYKSGDHFEYIFFPKEIDETDIYLILRETMTPKRMLEKTLAQHGVSKDSFEQLDLYDVSYDFIDDIKQLRKGDVKRPVKIRIDGKVDEINTDFLMVFRFFLEDLFKNKTLPEFLEILRRENPSIGEEINQKESSHKKGQPRPNTSNTKEDARKLANSLVKFANIDTSKVPTIKGYNALHPKYIQDRHNSEFLEANNRLKAVLDQIREGTLVDDDNFGYFKKVIEKGSSSVDIIEGRVVEEWFSKDDLSPDWLPILSRQLVDFLKNPSNTSININKCNICDNYFIQKNKRRQRCYSTDCEKSYQRKKKRKQRDSEPEIYS